MKHNHWSINQNHWSMNHSHWSMNHNHWSRSHNHCSMSHNHWSMSHNHWSMKQTHWSMSHWRCHYWVVAQKFPWFPDKIASSFLASGWGTGVLYSWRAAAAHAALRTSRSSRSRGINGDWLGLMGLTLW